MKNGIVSHHIEFKKFDGITPPSKYKNEIIQARHDEVARCQFAVFGNLGEEVKFMVKRYWPRGLSSQLGDADLACQSGKSSS